MDQPLNEYNQNGDFKTKISPESEASEAAEEPTTCLGFINDCFGYTSAQGFERVQDSIYKRNKIRIIFWTLVIIAAFGVFGWQTYGLVLKFLSKPVSTKVSIVNGKFIRFPAVTVCNLNMIRKSKLPQELQEDINNVSNSRGFFNSSNGNNRKRRSLSRIRRSSDNDTSWNDDYSDDFFDNSFADDDDDAYYDDDEFGDGYGDGDYDDCVDSECLGEPDDYVQDLQKKMAYTLTNYNATELAAMGHQFKDFIVECKWSGVDCAKGTMIKYWTRYFDLTYGNCFIFNGKPPSKQLKSLSLSKAGQTYGLNLKLNIEQNEYVEVASPEAGARITIGNKGNMPFPSNEGFSVPPGRSSSVGIQATSLFKLDPFQNKSCMSSNDLSKDSIYRKWYKARYTVEACLKTCVADNMFGRCGCTTYNFPNGKRTCDPEDNVKTKCTGEVYKAFLNSTLPCHKKCKELCNLNQYTRTVSSSEWPSNAEVPKVKNELDASGNAQLQQYVINGSTAIRSNMLKVQVFFRDLSVMVIQEELSYGWPEFLAEVGGFIGLYIGVSVVTVIECMELIVFILCCTRKKPKPPPPEDKVGYTNDQMTVF